MDTPFAELSFANDWRTSVLRLEASAGAGADRAVSVDGSAPSTLPSAAGPAALSATTGPSAASCGPRISGLRRVRCSEPCSLAWSPAPAEPFDRAMLNGAVTAIALGGAAVPVAGD